MRRGEHWRYYTPEQRAEIIEKSRATRRANKKQYDIGDGYSILQIDDCNYVIRLNGSNPFVSERYFHNPVSCIKYLSEHRLGNAILNNQIMLESNKIQDSIEHLEKQLSSLGN